ncbi:hypothetical protein BpHYR1_053064 [Brachionus plicatilis]|uniref:Uncharacterized protein n=1 Tax=Brachionus plicatilis TaxID=10195 RepID=A0A3M7T0T7_BRAPC|nr:hypothetical protein BpHYR1_053064 [Brachionus plicatilis]
MFVGKLFSAILAEKNMDIIKITKFCIFSNALKPHRQKRMQKRNLDIQNGTLSKANVRQTIFGIVRKN